VINKLIFKIIYILSQIDFIKKNYNKKFEIKISIKDCYSVFVIFGFGEVMGNILS